MRRLSLFAAMMLVAVALASAQNNVYSQPTNYKGEYASQNDPGGMGNFATAYDDFTLSSTSNITSVQWVGSFFNPQTQGTITGFTVDFYANNAGAPGTMLYTTGDIAGNAGQTGCTTDNIGDPTCFYSLSGLPAFVASGGTVYWLSIVPDLGSSHQWGWETGTGGDGVAYQCSFGNCGSVSSDLAFSLGTATTTTPEPSGALLLASALAGLGLVRGKRLVESGKRSSKLFQTLGMLAVVVLAWVGSASAQASSWTLLNNQPGLTGVGAMLQLRDGRILVHHEDQTQGYTDWYILTPDAKGSYVNGTWSSGGTFPMGYEPTYFGSQVLLKATTTNCSVVHCGQVIIQGGEYDANQSAFSPLGEWGTYPPFSGPVSWTPNAPPSPATELGLTVPWAMVGDASSVILANGSVLQSSCCNGQTAAGEQYAIFNGPTVFTVPTTSSWTETANGIQSNADQSGLSLLTNDLVLLVDTKTATGCPVPAQSSELYTVTDPSTGVGTWSCGPALPVQLYNGDEELGPTVVMYNNKVLQVGGSVNASAIYDIFTNTWAAGPTPCCGLDQSDGPAALEPNGKVLLDMSPGTAAHPYLGPCYFLEYDPVANTMTDETSTVIPQPYDCTQPANTNNTCVPTAPSDCSYSGHLMILPTGQIMFTAFIPQVEVYTPAPGVATWTCDTCTSGPTSASIPPRIFLSSTFLYSGSTNNFLYGYQLNGLSQNNFYGDDNQEDTNFPLARVTCVSGGCPVGNVYYAFTHDDGPAGATVHSIAPNHFGHTMFDLPTLPTGVYDFVAVTNGIQSNSIRVQVP